MKKVLLAVLLCAIGTTALAQTRPPNLSVVTEGTKVSVFWDTVIGADSYTLYGAPYPTGQSLAPIPMGQDTAVSAELNDGDAFYVAVTTTAGGMESELSNVETFRLSALNPVDAHATAAQAISNIVQTVIVGTYADLERRAAALVVSAINLNLNRTQENLLHAQQDWRFARRAWEQTEAFLYGPVDTQGLDPALDSWPVNRVDLDAVLERGDELTTDFIANLDDTLRGFHTIEYLLFGEANDKTAAELTDRELEYLLASTDYLALSAKTLADAWRRSQGNHVGEFLNAGPDSTLYPSEAAALEELVLGMAIIADEVGNGKIADPFSETNTELVESQFSYNSLLDFADNIRGIENIYIGRYLDNDGPGLNDLVRQTDTDLDERMRAAIDLAVTEIQAIPFPFRDAISTDAGRAQIEIAIDAVVALQLLIEGDLLRNLRQ